MEAFLLTMDLVGILILCMVVGRVHESGNPNDLGLFAYTDAAPRKEKRRGRNAGGQADA